MLSLSDPQRLISLVIALVVAISVHEAAHAFVAYKLGDPTAKLKGRLTLNPLAHLDIAGTIMLFLVGFGWGKPVPVNPFHFKNPVKDSALVSLAGPMSNFAVALLVSVPLNYLRSGMDPFVFTLLSTIVDLNILLGIFNFLPFPPLDGSKIFAVFIPKEKQAGYFNFLQKSQSYFIAFVLIDLLILGRYFNFSIIWTIIGNLFFAIKSLFILGG